MARSRCCPASPTTSSRATCPTRARPSTARCGRSRTSTSTASTPRSRSQGGGTRVFLPTTALTEVNLEAGGGGAEYGRNVGSHTNLIVKSGTNKFHGDFNGVYSKRRGTRTTTRSPRWPRTSASSTPSSTRASRQAEAEDIGRQLGRLRAGRTRRRRDQHRGLDRRPDHARQGLVLPFPRRGLDQPAGQDARRTDLQRQLRAVRLDRRSSTSSPAPSTASPTPSSTRRSIASSCCRRWAISYVATFFQPTRRRQQPVVELVDQQQPCSSRPSSPARSPTRTPAGRSRPEPRRRTRTTSPNPALGIYSPNNNDALLRPELRQHLAQRLDLRRPASATNEFPRDQLNLAMHAVRRGQQRAQVRARPAAGGVEPGRAAPGHLLGRRTSQLGHHVRLRQRLLRVHQTIPCCGRDTRCFFVDYNGHGLTKGAGVVGGENYGAYVRDRLTLGDHWTFNLGLRYEDQELENDRDRKVIDAGHAIAAVLDGVRPQGRRQAAHHLQRRSLLRADAAALVNTNLQEDWNGASNAYDLLLSQRRHALQPRRFRPTRDCAAPRRHRDAAHRSVSQPLLLLLGSVRPGTLWQLRRPGSDRRRHRALPSRRGGARLRVAVLDELGAGRQGHLLAGRQPDRLDPPARPQLRAVPAGRELRATTPTSCAT